VFRGAAAGMMIPAVGEQDTADIKEQRRDREVFFHEIGVLRDISMGLAIELPQD
jgi:hypothetical protein